MSVFYSDEMEPQKKQASMDMSCLQHHSLSSSWIILSGKFSSFLASIVLRLLCNTSIDRNILIYPCNISVHDVSYNNTAIFYI